MHALLGWVVAVVGGHVTAVTSSRRLVLGQHIEELYNSFSIVFVFLNQINTLYLVIPRYTVIHNKPYTTQQTIHDIKYIVVI